ncbi:MAG TPA: type II toxin-antitoxin system mRNA interferase toxin, RelE/StbE family [Eubacteriaceae bacterium]|jgi:mRNA interferase RelE/StbE|nr:type II toxin-antitoxin system mRNA interferase toxin, RelE/StbE family [Eubacteriaceae bacterium]
MHYKVVISDKSLKQLKKLDSAVQRLIINFIEKNLEGSTDPRLLGKGLKGNLKGIWRYRVGDYRLLAKIEDEKLIIVFVDIGHRKNIYTINKF